MSDIEPYSADAAKRRKRRENDELRYSDIEKKKFNPVTSPIEITRTRFSVQFGTINEKWASVLLRDNRIIATHIYREEDLDSSGFPNKRLIADWVLGIVAIPALNPQEIMRLIQTLSKQCEKR